MFMSKGSGMLSKQVMNGGAYGSGLSPGGRIIPLLIYVYSLSICVSRAGADDSSAI